LYQGDYELSANPQAPFKLNYTVTIYAPQLYDRPKY
jgi:hypothetical protein